MEQRLCYHCGDQLKQVILFEDKTFCCDGCRTVYDLFIRNGLSAYYSKESAPGASPINTPHKFDFLENPEIASQLLEFDEGNTQVIEFYLPHIHCSSCIWILEHLHKLNPNIYTAQVNFPRKSLRLSFDRNATNLKEIAIFLSGIGYEPLISLQDGEVKRTPDRTHLYKLGVAGFAFGNIMFLSFPEYFEVSEYWLNQYKTLFRWLMFAFSVPLLTYVTRDYFISAYRGLRKGLLNIDVPLALGLAVLFLRSTLEIILDWGPGFFDSLAGLAFFLTLGKIFQEKTHNFLSFERDYKSYFPIGITRISEDGTEKSVHVQTLKKGDWILIRNQELIPVDAVLVTGEGRLDYSFVTGESEPIDKTAGEKLYSGGRQLGEAIVVEVTKPVSQSYLTSLWANQSFQEEEEGKVSSLINRISHYFTVILLLLALTAAIYWISRGEMSIAVSVFTAVLIIACPCALAMSTPFALGNMLRIFGRNKCYLKNAQTVEALASANAIVFDKTGTMTTSRKHQLHYEGSGLNDEELALLKSSLRSSNHPLSRGIYEFLPPLKYCTPSQYSEAPGAGITAVFNQTVLKVGSSLHTGGPEDPSAAKTGVHISFNGIYRGQYIFHNIYRKRIEELLQSLKSDFSVSVISGDNEGEKDRLRTLLPSGSELRFNQSPQQKLDYIKELQKSGKRVIMVGDGLNDAGALKQSNAGMAISENVNIFSPACDAIVDASVFHLLYDFIKASRAAIQVIRWSVLLSFLYNFVGIYFAVTNQLSPVIAAILMPLSSISVIGFSLFWTNRIGKAFTKMS